MSELRRIRWAAIDGDHTTFQGGILVPAMTAVRQVFGLPLLERDLYGADREADELRALAPAITGQPVALLEAGDEAVRQLVNTRLYLYIGELIAGCLARGITPVILSRSPNRWVQVVASELPGIALALGSELVVENGHYTGEIHPLDKVAALGRLAERGYEPAPCLAITDSLDDLDLLKHVHKAGGVALAFCSTEDGYPDSYLLCQTIDAERLPFPILSQDRGDPSIWMREYAEGAGGIDRLTSVEELLQRLDSALTTGVDK